MFSIIKEAKKTALDFSQGTVKVLQSVIEWFSFYQNKMTQYNSLKVTLSTS